MLREATVYALLAGFQNFGQAVAGAIGVLLIDLFAIRTVPLHDEAGIQVENCDFSNTPYLILISHICLPLVAIPFTFWLIPDARYAPSLFFCFEVG